MRACQCGFCRNHGAISTSDPRGELRFLLKDQAELIRYRFATGSAKFLICAICGVYVGAQMETDGRFCAIVNLRTLENADTVELKAEAVDYSGEDAAARRARRDNRWTPVITPA